MQTSKLFRVLVLGGALIGCGGAVERKTEDPSTSTVIGEVEEMIGIEFEVGVVVPDSGVSTDAPSLVDAGDPAADAGEVVADAGDVELASCFCGSGCECAPGANGTLVPPAGFECCWGTSC